MYAFASGITTAMLSGIGASLCIMVCMTVAALFHRVAMGGKQDQKAANKNWEGSIPMVYCTYTFFPECVAKGSRLYCSWGLGLDLCSLRVGRVVVLVVSSWSRRGVVVVSSSSRR